MKATGIVRRIDDLGRIVIPKEIRRTLRIRETDPLEIFTDKAGEIVLKKYSPMGELTGLASQCAKSVSEVTGRITIVTDREFIIATSNGFKELVGRDISNQLLNAMENRVLTMTQKEKGNTFLLSTFQNEQVCEEYLIMPIICQGDVIGSVILAQVRAENPMGEAEQKVVKAFAGFLGKHFET